MSKQNVYDNQELFDNYARLREKKENANLLIEMPAILSLFPNLEGKTVLDLGCGQGDHCFQFVSLGAKKVVGIDISEKMIKLARTINAHEKITYQKIAMEDIKSLNEQFDIIASSLAFHYVKDLSLLLIDLHQLLKENGFLLFSQEHPLATTFDDSHVTRWEKDNRGNKISARVRDYCREGKRLTKWFDVEIIKYHRTFATIVNELVDTGFMIERVVEPVPDEDIMERYPEYRDNYLRPDFLIIKAKKISWDKLSKSSLKENDYKKTI
ncbi:MAG: class I SAM-dependent methyltransferase [Bacilli bacterium]|jgi:SAM-dependent methyltransferase|nr:class I SAM-dependent methyltransferase [Acholeplasmataceae bacterium]